MAVCSVTHDRFFISDLSKNPRCLLSIAFRHIDIHENQYEASAAIRLHSLLDYLNCFVAILCLVDSVARHLGEDLLQTEPYELIIIHHQNINALTTLLVPA